MLAVSTRSAGMRWGFLSLAVLLFILVPFALVGASLDSWAVGWVNERASHRLLLALAVMALLATDVVLPVPSSIVSTAAGALLGFVPGMLVSLAGMTVGSAIGYGLGRTVGRGAARPLVGEVELARLGEATERHGMWVLVVARAVPVLAEASTIFAGMSRMPPRRFFSVIILASAGVSVAYAAVGAFAVQWGSFLFAFGGSVLIPLFAMAYWRRTA